jgi:transposase
VSAIARSHGLDPSQLFAWRRKALASGMVAPVSGAGGQAVKFARFDAVTSDIVEIVIGDVVVRVVSDLEPERLAAVIRAVRQAWSRRVFRFTWPARRSTSAREQPA